jgi:S1-C subfamily serine protease
MICFILVLGLSRIYFDEVLMKAKKNSIRIFSIITILVLTVLACGGTTGATTRDLEITISTPSETINAGDTFSVTVALFNSGSYNLELSSIQLPNDLVNSAKLISTNPALSTGTTTGDKTSYPFINTLAPNGNQTVTFTFEANQSGTISGTGGVTSNAGTTNFSVRVDVSGSTETVWTPGASFNQTPAPLGAIPYQAVVQILAVVNVEGQETIGWTGSGTIISPDGLILTNAHVILSDRFYTVTDLIVAMTVAQDSPPVQSYLASVLQVDANLDIAVIKVRADINGNPVNNATLNLPAVTMGNSDSLQLGDAITIIGYPGIGGETVTLTRGEVSGFTSESPYGNRAFVKTSATIAGGNSGGLAANSAGEIIGIPTQLGSGDIEAGYVDCRALADTNRDGYVDENDSCIPTGGFINALRPIKLAMSLIDAARQGQVAVDVGGTDAGEEYTPTGNVDYFDDFSDPNSGWYVASDADGSSAYINGEMVIEVNSSNWILWSYIPNSTDNIIMSVDARVIKGVGDGDFGFICGLQDSENFTVLEIAEDGYFSAWKYQNNEFISLYDWAYSDIIAAGGPYTLAAFCGSQKLALAVNETLLFEINDPYFRVGDIGVMAGVYEQVGIKVGFDNFQLMLP